MTDEDEALAAARMKVRLRADPMPPAHVEQHTFQVRTAPRHACPSCGMVHFVQGGGR